MEGKFAHQHSTLLASDFDSFKRQEDTLVALSLVVLVVLLLAHNSAASHWGKPSPTLITVLVCGFALNAAELVWLHRTRLSTSAMRSLTWWSVVLNMLLSFVLGALSDNEDAQYFALMVVPVLKSAFRLSLRVTMIVVAVASALDLFLVWAYFRSHPPANSGEYFESGTISLIYAIVGFAVWLLVDHLRRKENDLARSLAELQQTRERLMQEEKLAAVGRLSSAIAHEIRNPVAVISSSLATAMRGRLDSAGRQEMFEIAAKESIRLENLTSDFLAYAKPRDPLKKTCAVADIVGYVAGICQSRAAEKGIALGMEVAEELVAEMDVGQMQQALLNLLINALEASERGGRVRIRAVGDGQSVRIDIENANGPIPAEVAARVFEPFFSNKPGGTGLGLSIARGIALAHGGELALSRNEAQAVCFSLILPLARVRDSRSG